MSTSSVTCTTPVHDKISETTTTAAFSNRRLATRGAVTLMKRERIAAISTSNRKVPTSICPGKVLKIEDAPVGLNSSSCVKLVERYEAKLTGACAPKS